MIYKCLSNMFKTYLNAIIFVDKVIYQMHYIYTCMYSHRYIPEVESNELPEPAQAFWGP